MLNKESARELVLSNLPDIMAKELLAYIESLENQNSNLGWRIEYDRIMNLEIKGLHWIIRQLNYNDLDSYRFLCDTLGIER